MKRLALHEIEHNNGTVQLLSGTTGLQHKEGTSIVLVPQPNLDDPNDPLNWPFAKRVAAFWSSLWMAALCNFCITGLAPGFSQLIPEFDITITQASWLLTSNLLGQFMGVFTLAPLASKYGKRPVWLSISLVFFVCNIWASVAKSYPSLLLARLFAAYACGTSEPLSVDQVHDLFFLHERGTQTGVQAIWLCWGSSMAPVICGYLIQAKGWRWFHWLTSIMAGVDLLLIFFLTPETQYKRDLHKAFDLVAIDEHSGDDADTSAPEVAELKTGAESSAMEGERTTTRIRKKTYLEELKPWSYSRKDVSLLASYLRPWETWCYPSVAWSALSFSMHISAYLVLITLIPIYLGAPPYNFTIGQQGLVYLASVICQVIGAFSCGFMNDKLSQWSTKRNRGVFEPEMRLPVTIVPIVLVPAGLLMFGIGVAHQAHWIVPVIGSGLVASATTAIPAICQTYLMDSYPPITYECNTTFNGFKNIVAFAIGFAIVPWIETNGLVTVFCILVALVVVIDAGVVIIYLYGKKFRQRDARLKVFHF